MNVLVLIFISSMGIYGEVPGETYRSISRLAAMSSAAGGARATLVIAHYRKP